jgi:hypothetical protein
LRRAAFAFAFLRGAAFAVAAAAARGALRGLRRSAVTSFWIF